MSILFTHLCDLYEVIPGTQGRLGSKSRQLRLVMEAAPCTFIVQSERAVDTTNASLVQIETSLLFVPPRVALVEEMVVKNIRQKDETVIEAGPLVVDTINDHRAPGHSLHHQLAMLRRDLSVEKEQV